MTTIAQEISDQIEKHYEYEGRVYINGPDLITHLKNDLIDRNQKPDHGHRGFNESFDQSLCVFFYKDNSILVVSSQGGLSPSG